MGQPHAASHVPWPCPMQIQRVQQQQPQHKLQLDNAQFIQWLLLLLLSLFLVVAVVLVLIAAVVVVALRRRRLVHTLQFCYIFFCSTFFCEAFSFSPSCFFCTSLCYYFPCAWALEAPPLPTNGGGRLAVGAGAGTDNQPERGVEQLEHCNYLFVLVTLGVWGIPTNPSGCRSPYTPASSPALPSAFCRIFLLCARLLHDFRTMTAPAESKLHFLVALLCSCCVPLLPVSLGSWVG